MSAYHQPRAVWAGVAIRFADGSLRTFELKNPTDFKIVMEAIVEDETTSWDVFRRQRVVGHTVDIQISGFASAWADFRGEDAPKPTREIETSLAIEGSAA